MFLCEECHSRTNCKFPHAFRSYGRCEGCGKTAECYDCRIPYPTKQEEIEGRIKKRVTHLAELLIKDPKLRTHPESEIETTSRDIYRDLHPQGAVIKVEELPCPRCKGSGSIETGVLRGGVFTGKDIKCPDCKGTGRVKAGYRAVEP